ncbi:NAD-dependent succinate-semialdehyde dehydrogenase [Mariniluteicoccus endophyticus]
MSVRAHESDQVRALLGRVPRTQFIGGQWSTDLPTMEVHDPATGAVLTTVADADADTGVRALDAACAAARDWARTLPRERAEILRRAYELVIARGDDLATLMTLEMGKPLAEARGEVTYGAEFLRWFSEEAVRIDGRWGQAPNNEQRMLIMKQPVGPVYAITPWNFPLAMGTRKIAPALAAGCTVVLKPAAETPLTSLVLMEILAEAGVPDGVVNCVVTSDAAGVSTPIIGDPRLRKLTFTGSTAVGKKLIAQSAEHVLRTSMELGGNAALLVLESADLDRAVDGALAAKMRNGGEACVSANRILVHERHATEFGRRLAERMGAMKVGPGLADGVEVGPLITDVALDKVSGLVADAVHRGARVLTGGERSAGDGWFWEPTVLVDVPDDARVMHEEIFGPVAPITTFTDLDQALALANDVEHGLMGYVFGENLGEALRAAEGLETGMVGLNSGVVSQPAAPFGGVKQSGLGREGSREGVEEYLETKYVGIAL